MILEHSIDYFTEILTFASKFYTFCTFYPTCLSTRPDPTCLFPLVTKLNRFYGEFFFSSEIIIIFLYRSVTGRVIYFPPFIQIPSVFFKISIFLISMI